MNTITSTPHPTIPEKVTLLRTTLLLDAAITGVNGLAYLILPAQLATVFGTPALFLMAAGGFLFCCAIVFLLIGRASRIPSWGVWFAILVNTAWAVASIVFVLTSDWLTQIGQLWGVLQALVVFGFGIAQLLGWRRSQS
ncbi:MULTISPECIES: hypothetical protein [unclassified Brevibacterium]|uniref:hypothetical protein n=1 Tax=unclassified Brevibacterium TaxID=2614124 RepID=UPI001092B1CB|nr:hypothetical protein [Brevibacterium sp. S22]